MFKITRHSKPPTSQNWSQNNKKKKSEESNPQSIDTPTPDFISRKLLCFIQSLEIVATILKLKLCMMKIKKTT